MATAASTSFCNLLYIEALQLFTSNLTFLQSSQANYVICISMDMLRNALVLLGCIFIIAACRKDDVAAKNDYQNPSQIILLDVQGLWGGQDVWLSMSGKCYARKVIPPEVGESGLQEERYEFECGEDQLNSLLVLIKKHKIFNIKIEDRSGVPDEAKPLIYLKADEKAVSVEKWANDQDKDFDPVYDYLSNILKGVDSKSLIYRGNYDALWHPAAFPSTIDVRRKITE